MTYFKRCIILLVGLYFHLVLAWWGENYWKNRYSNDGIR